MQSKLIAATVSAFALVTGAGSVSADPQRQGDLHVTKECTAYDYTAGSHCTITSSNLAAIPVGAKVYYDQAAGTPAGFLDSNVLLDAGILHWATGRCTVDNAAFSAIGAVVGLCTYSDGTGPLTGFHARVNVSWLGGVNYGWDGTYRFTSLGNLK
jgi:hypothetical protein